MEFANSTSQPCVMRCGSERENHSYGRPHEEYCADFYLVTKRALDETEWRLFQLHFLQQLPWRECCPKLSLDRGRFFHAVYASVAKLGTAYMNIKPYPLFPLSAYFGCHVHTSKKAVETVERLAA
jgi:hypothetical protein